MMKSSLAEAHRLLHAWVEQHRSANFATVVENNSDEYHQLLGSGWLCVVEHEGYSCFVYLQVNEGNA